MSAGRQRARHSMAPEFWLLGTISLLIVSTCTAQTDVPTVLVQGRFSPGSQAGRAGLPQTISWASSSIYTTFRGATSVSLKFTATPPTNVSYAINWLRFFIDDETVGDGFTSYKKTELAVTIPVTKGNHSLRITKLSDPSKGTVTLDSIRLNSGSFLDPEEPVSIASGRRILILGDSYSVGYGDAGASIPNTCAPSLGEMSSELRGLCQNQQIPDNECPSYIQVMNGNSLAAFGPVVADAFSADFQLLATAGGGLVGYSYGIGAHPDWDIARIQTILPSNADCFNRTLFFQNVPPYDAASWLPQVVIVASGTNDWYSSPPEYTLKDWLTKAVSFLRKINDSFDEPIIIIQAWSATTQNLNAVADANYDANGVATYLEAMPALVREANSKGLSNVYYLGLDAKEYTDTGSWCGGHPSALAHKSVARQVVTAIEKYMPTWNVSSPVTLSVDQEAIRPNLTLLGSR